MNSREMYNYAKEKESIWSDKVLKQRISELDSNLRGWEIVTEECWHATTNRPVWLFRDRATGRYVDQNIEPCIRTEDGKFLTESEFISSRQTPLLATEPEYFTAEELVRFDNIRDTYHTDTVLSYSSSVRRGIATEIYNRVGVLRDGPEDTSFTIGFEIETNKAEGCYWHLGGGTNISHLLDHRLGHIENDSSISGIEFDSHIFTWNKLKKCKPLFQKQLLAFAENGLTASKGAGLHIHIGRNAFTSRESLQKFYFILNYRNFQTYWQSLARRDQNSYCMYKQLRKDDRAALLRTMSNNADNHGEAVNQQHSSTIEVRIFQSTLSSDVLYATIEMLVNLVNFCNSSDMEFKFDKILTGEYIDTLKRVTRHTNSQEALSLMFIIPKTEEEIARLMREALESGRITEALRIGNDWHAERSAE